MPEDPIYTTVFGTDMRIGLAALTVPAWRSAMTALTWTEITSTTKMSDIDPEDSASTNPNHPADADYRGNNGQDGITKAWNGGIWDETNQRLLLGPAGGHNDYYGNETYEWSAATGEFSRLTDPTATSALMGDISSAAVLYADSRPRSFHTYSNYCVRNGVLWFFGGAPSSTVGGFASAPFYWNGTDWVRDADISTQAGSSGMRSAVYNPDTDKIWVFPASNVGAVIYDPIAKTTTQHTNVVGMGDDKQAFYLQSPDVFLIFGSGIRVMNGANDAVPITTSGTQPTFTDFGAAGIIHDTLRNRFLCWEGGADVYVLTPPVGVVNGTWVWSQLTLDASNVVTPTAQEPAGTFQRFWFSPSLNCVGVVNNVTENMYALALEDI